MTSIRLQQIAKRFDSHQAVAPLDLTIQSGSLFALLGPSGCGKTTLLRMIAGLEQQDQGQIFFDDVDVSQQFAEQRRIGMVFQHYALFPHMTVAENVAFGLKTQGVAKALLRDKVEQALRTVDLAHKIDHACPALSGGEQQRVALARAIVIEPAVLLFDEPLSNLDARLRIETRQAIRQLVQHLNITSIFVTHDQEEALSIADEMAVMRDGKVLQQGSPENCYRQPRSSFVGNFLGRANIFTDLSALKNAFPERLANATSNEVLIRPEHLSLCTAEQAVLSGKLVLREFQGAQQRLHIQTPNSGLIEVTLGSNIDCPAVDETVFLSCHADQLICFDG